jgi:hypothetical protein
VTAVAYFATVYLGLKTKLRVLARPVCFEQPDGCLEYRIFVFMRLLMVFGSSFSA